MIIFTSVVISKMDFTAVREPRQGNFLWACKGPIISSERNSIEARTMWSPCSSVV